MGLLPPNHRPAAALVRKATLLYILVTFFLKALREDALWRHLNLLRSSIYSCSCHAEHLPRLLYVFRHLIFFIFVSENIRRTTLPPKEDGDFCHGRIMLYIQPLN